MDADDYPWNDDIQEILKAIEKIKATKDWAALFFAESELEHLLYQKNKWIKYRGFENK